MDNSSIYYDLYGALVSLLNRYTQQNNQITYTTMCIQCIHLHSLGSFYLHLPHLYSDVILYWLKTTEGFRQKSAYIYPLELIQGFNFRLCTQTKLQFSDAGTGRPSWAVDPFFINCQSNSVWMANLKYKY